MTFDEMRNEALRRLGKVDTESLKHAQESMLDAYRRMTVPQQSKPFPPIKPLDMKPKPESFDDQFLKSIGVCPL